MKKTHRKWHIDVLHHSHTDLGYTARQELVFRQHADFLRRAVEILRGIDAGEAQAQRGFCWQCENWWQIANFLRFVRVIGTNQNLHAGDLACRSFRLTGADPVIYHLSFFEKRQLFLNYKLIRKSDLIQLSALTSEKILFS